MCDTATAFSELTSQTAAADIADDIAQKLLFPLARWEKFGEPDLRESHEWLCSAIQYLYDECHQADRCFSSLIRLCAEPLAVLELLILDIPQRPELLTAEVLETAASGLRKVLNRKNCLRKLSRRQFH